MKNPFSSASDIVLMTPCRGNDARRIGRMGIPGRRPARKEPPEAAESACHITQEHRFTQRRELARTVRPYPFNHSSAIA